MMTEEQAPRRWLVWAGGIAACAVPLGVYLITLARTITFEDSGQLITAASSLGICHPSGYPLAMLTGQFFTLLPIGRMAFRVNMASAAAAAAACLVLYLLVRRLLIEWKPKERVAATVAAAAAAIAFGFSRTFWSQAVVTEAYALDAFCLAATLAAGLTWARTRDPRWGYLTVFLGGLALGAHSSSAIVTVPLAVYLLIRFRRLPNTRSAMLGLVLIALGFFVYIYLPLRAVQEPVMNWGDPRNLRRMYNHITRHIYGGPNPERLQFIWVHWRELAGFIWRQFSPAGAVLAAAGTIWAVLKRPRPWGLFAILAAITGPIATVALVLLLMGHQIREVEVWYIPFFMLMAAFVALGLFALLATRRRVFSFLGWAAALAAAVTPLILNWQWNDFHNYYFAEDWGGNYLRTIDYEGYNIMFERGSLGTFETAYLRKIEHFRPDNNFVDATGTVYREFRAFAQGRLENPRPELAGLWEREFERSILALAGERGVYYSIEREEVRANGYVLDPAGLLYLAHPPTSPLPKFPSVWRRYVRRGQVELEATPRTPRNNYDEWARESVSRFHVMLARQYFAAGEREKGFAELARGAAVGYELTESLADIANQYMLNGRPDLSVKYNEEALAAFPRKGVGDPAFRQHYSALMANKAIAYLWLGDLDNAEKTYKEAYDAWPDPDLAIAMKRENLEAALADINSFKGNSR